MRTLGPAERYDVRSEGLDAANGVARKFQADGRRVRPLGGPVLDRVRIDARDLALSEDRDAVRSYSSLGASAELRAEDARDFLRGRLPFGDLDVKFRRGPRLTITGRRGSERVEIDGDLIPEGSRLALRLGDLRLNGRVVPGVALLGTALDGRIPPLVDLSRLPVPLRIADVRERRGRLIVDAVADVK